MANVGIFQLIHLFLQGAGLLIIAIEAREGICRLAVFGHIEAADSLAIFSHVLALQQPRTQFANEFGIRFVAKQEVARNAQLLQFFAQLADGFC